MAGMRSKEEEERKKRKRAVGCEGYGAEIFEMQDGEVVWRGKTEVESVGRDEIVSM